MTYDHRPSNPVASIRDYELWLRTCDCGGAFGLGAELSPFDGGADGAGGVTDGAGAVVVAGGAAEVSAGGDTVVSMPPTVDMLLHFGQLIVNVQLSHVTLMIACFPFTLIGSADSLSLSESKKIEKISSFRSDEAPPEPCGYWPVVVGVGRFESGSVVPPIMVPPLLLPIPAMVLQASESCAPKPAEFCATSADRLRISERPSLDANEIESGDV
uniref:Uncharacterized protein n=1 Tax=Anopheles culicifacies TaxID=139723 RepID=A0A182LRY9_9DIPT